MLETIFQHRSYRKFKNTTIPQEILQKILEGAIRGSNTGNMQVYSIIVSTDSNIKERLWECHFKQDMVKNAPVILTFCADINRFNKWCEYRNTQPSYDNFLWFYNATIDAIIAAQNACIVAEHFELGICYLGTTTYMADKIIQILNLPKGVVPVTSVVVGYPDESPELTDRLPMNGVVHYQTYKDYDNQSINELYKEKENLEQTKKLIEINQTNNLAEIFTNKRYTRKDNLYFANQFLNVLANQMFMNNNDNT